MCYNFKIEELALEMEKTALKEKELSGFVSPCKMQNGKEYGAANKLNARRQRISSWSFRIVGRVEMIVAKFFALSIIFRK